MDARSKVIKAITAADKVLLVGYCPTGGGHIGRTFNIIEQAIVDGHLTKDSTVIFHCPPKCDENIRQELNNITNVLQKQGINIIFTLGDKAVYGPWKKDGSSDDAQILRRFAMYPLRKKNKHSNVFECGMLWTVEDAKDKDAKDKKAEEKRKPTEQIYSDVVMPEITISAKDLIHSLTKEIPLKKMFVLTDMDPYLQKAAIAAGAPPDQCLDQQNHAILLSEGKDPFIVENAYLAKVLSASGGRISHIGLGDKNTLSAVNESVIKLGINKDTSKVEAKKMIIKLLNEKGKKLPLDKVYDRTLPGVIWPPNLDEKEVKHVVYIYAHNATAGIGEHIRKQIEAKDPNYTNKVFLICGPNAVEGYNAMHLAYLVDGDGITAAGAGTTGEFTYLHKKGGAESRLLLLPQPGQNEQKANADFVAKTFPGKVTVEEKPDGIDSQVDNLVGLKPLRLISEQTMELLLTAISDPNTYAKQASDILFRKESHVRSEELRLIESKMRQDPALKMNRKYIKAVFQLLEELRVDKVVFPLKIRLKKSDEPIELKDIGAVIELFENDSRFLEILNPLKDQKEQAKEKRKTPDSISPDPILRHKVIAFFKDCQALTPEKRREAIDALEEEFGAKMTTGY